MTPDDDVIFWEKIVDLASRLDDLSTDGRGAECARFLETQPRHDMGEGLSDGRPDYDASPTEWRTPPLWGLGLSKIVTGSTSMLHDGRAANAIEAILWHGGEAQTSRDAFLKMTT